MFHNRSFVLLVGLALLMAGSIFQVYAQAPTPTTAVAVEKHFPGKEQDDLVTGSSMPASAALTEANKALVRRYVDQVPNGGHFEVLDDVLSPNYKRFRSAAAEPLDAAGNKQRLAGLRMAFPDLKITIEDLIAERDLVVYRGTVRGTQQAAFMGIPPTGKQVMVTVHESFRIENGKIAEHWGGPDTLDLLQQLGAEVGPPPAEKK